MGGPNIFSLAESYSNWWTLSGVDALVGEIPAGWLDAPPINDNKPKEKSVLSVVETAPPPLPEALLKKAEPEQADSSAPLVFPETWDEFRPWLANASGVPGTQWDAKRVLPVGEAGAKLMLITAWPEMDCQRRGELFCGDAGKLLDNMLKAIGLTRDDCYLSSMAITRPAGGRCNADDLPEMERLLKHHIKLAQPQKILLIGSDITRIMMDITLTAARGKVLEVNQDVGSIDAVAVPHPAILLNRPSHKAAAWDSLKLFNHGI